MAQIESTGAAVDMAAPVRAADRIDSLDVLRGVAVLGIMLLNILFALPGPGHTPVPLGDTAGVDFWAWAVPEVVFEGTMRTIFSMLFGAGAVLFVMRAEAKDPLRAADLYYRRTILLIGFGLVHSYLVLWGWDILYFYGVAGMFLYPLRRLSPRWLIGLGLAVLVGSSTVHAVVDARGHFGAKAAAAEARSVQEAGEELTEEQQDAIDEWTERVEESAPSAEAIQEEIDANRSGYFGVMAHLAPKNAEGQSTGLLGWGLWDVGSMMLIGMGLMKLGVLTGERRARVYVGMMVVGYGAGIALNVYETVHVVRAGYSMEAFFESWRTYNLGRLLVATGHIGLVVLVVKSGALKWLTRPLGAVGRMALTNYMAQSVLCNLFFMGFGLGMYARLERAELYLVVVVVWALQLVWSPLWLARFRFGPLEWVWRSLTYGKAQPMLRRGPVGVSIA